MTARAHLAGLEQTWSTTVRPAISNFVRRWPHQQLDSPERQWAETASGCMPPDTLVAELDGRYWTAEICAFTGRVIGLYASEGTVRFANFRHRGTEG